MLGKKSFSRKGAKPGEFEKTVKNRLSKLEKKEPRPDGKLAEKVESLQEAVRALRSASNKSLPVPPGVASKLTQLEQEYSELRQAMVKLPDNGNAGLIVKVSRLEKECDKLDAQVDNLGKVLSSLSGISGSNGQVGNLEKRYEKLETRVGNVERLHYKVLALCTVGSISGGALVKFLF